MKKIFYMLLAVMMNAISCNKIDIIPEPETEKKETVKDILVAVQNVYKVERMTEGDDEYIISFDEPKPITVIEEHPKGIEKVNLKKSDVKTLVNGSRNIRVEFKDETVVTLDYTAWLSVKFTADYVSFDENETPVSLSFEIEESQPEAVSAKAVGCEECATAEVCFDESGNKGTVVFTPISSSAFVKEAAVEFSNGKRTVSLPVTLIREDLKFYDGTVQKSFSFKEYERYFELRLFKADKSVSVDVPSESSWIRALVSNVNVDGVDQTTICFLLSENAGSSSRDARVLVKREGYQRELTVDIHQIGADMDGSLKKGLLGLYSGLHGAEWIHNDGWGSDRPFFEWYGIQASNVVSKAPFGEAGSTYFGVDDRWALNISANNMRGQIPDSFWKVADCFYCIRINNEYLAGNTVPEDVWHGNLEVLDLSFSFMNVPLGPSIANASSLISLSLQSCNVGGALPQEISSCSKLQEINLRECCLTGGLPSDIGSLSELRSCWLDHNMDLGGVLPAGFYNLTKLRSFDVSATKIGGTLSSDVARLVNLESFDISGCEFKGTIPEEFGNLNKLAVYEFNGNYFSSIPQFVRYRGYNSRPYKQWVGSAGFPLGVPFYQRQVSDGRPENYIVVVKDAFEMSDIMVNGQPLKRPGYYVDYDKCRMAPLPVWANVKYGIFSWISYHDGAAKFPEYPYADDLQYSADDYYYDGKEWRHPNLEYPAREYFYDGRQWVHDSSCPWDKEYREQ